MGNKTFIIVVVILAVVAAAGLVSYLPSRIDSASKIKVSAFPMNISGWKAKDMAISQREYEILETKNLFLREYTNPMGDLLYLYVIYSEDNRKVSHPPEVCLLGSGVTIVEKSKIRISNSIKANLLLVEKTSSQQIVVYWYKAGRLNTDSYFRQQVKVCLDRLLNRRTCGALIRISVDVKDNNTAETVALADSFAKKIEPLLEKYIP